MDQQKCRSHGSPHFVFNGSWAIKSDGAISVHPDIPDWDNGDIGQRSVSLLCGMTDYYRYSGDPAAIGIISLTADYVLDYCQTPADHPWPQFMISCPTKGKGYGGPTRTASFSWTLRRKSGRNW